MDSACSNLHGDTWPSVIRDHMKGSLKIMVERGADGAEQMVHGGYSSVLFLAVVSLSGCVPLACPSFCPSVRVDELDLEFAETHLQSFFSVKVTYSLVHLRCL